MLSKEALQRLSCEELEKIADDESLPTPMILAAWTELLNRLEAFYGQR